MLVRIIKDWNKQDNLLKQTSGENGQWGNIKFTLDPVTECDVVVFTNRIKEDCLLSCRPGGRWLIQMEPPTPAHRWYRNSDEFFDRIIAPDWRVKKSKLTYSHGALPWHVDRTYDQLKVMQVPNKPCEVSMITSNANYTNGHSFRLRLINALKGVNGIDFDLYGRGFNRIDDKMDAHLSYKYSIVIENSFYPHYWTEKLSDCLLSFTIPIYIGAQNIGDYLPQGSFIQVEPDLNKVIKVLKTLHLDQWEGRMEALKEARNKILDEYQLFPLLSNLIDQNILNEDRKSFEFKANLAPWEGGKISILRKMEYQYRKLFNLKPF